MPQRIQLRRTRGWRMPLRLCGTLHVEGGYRR